MEKYPEVAEIVKKHMLYDIIEPGLANWEEKIVYYADKIVNNNKIVTLDERFEYLNARYPPKDSNMRNKIFGLCKELEKDILDAMGMKWEELVEAIGTLK